MDILPTDGAGAPAKWFLIFRRRTESRLVRWLAWGEFKHVRAFAYVGETDTWVFFDCGWGRASVFLARGAGARALIGEWVEDSAVLSMAATTATTATTALRPMLCTTAVAHLVGLRCALRPTALFHDCLRHGAHLVAGAPIGQTPGPALDHPVRSPA